ncbi:CDP-glycerol glycerophosphotransferase family protein [Octadecabacter sp.]|nr:CDP-glycerol glycerophosphotransferase family protein [Octadecabacter sp.]
MKFFKWFQILISNLLWLLLSFFTNIFPRKREKWLFLSHIEYGFADNAKYLFLSEFKNPNYKFLWCTKSKDLHDQLNSRGYNSVLKGSLSYYINLVTSRVIVFDSYLRGADHYLSIGASKINLWHGVGIKKTDYDIDVGRRAKYYKKGIYKRVYQLMAPHLYQHVHTRLFNVPSQYYLSVSEKAFGLDRHQLIHGLYPRLEALIGEYTNEMEIGCNPETLKLLSEEKRRKIFYAPTFRDEIFIDGINTKQSDIINKICDEILQPNDVLIYKPHFVDGDFEIPSKSNLVLINGNEDSYPYLRLADILVTDYSSIATDFISTGRPVLIFAYDLAHYLRNCRGFYFELSLLSGEPVAQSFDELNNLLSKTTSLNSPDSKTLEMFHDNIDKLETNSFLRKISFFLFFKVDI